MSFFSRFFGNSSNDVADATLDFKPAKAFGKLIVHQQFTEAEQLYRGLSWEGRSLVLAGIHTAPGAFDGPAQQWTKTAPDLALAHLCYGLAQTHLGWEVRTNKVADDVTREQAMGFFEHLQRAFQHLELAESLDPQDANIHAALQPVYMGLESPQSDAEELFARMKQVEPTHLGGHMAMLNALTPKWGGSIEAMTAFAEAHYRDSPVLVTLALGSLINEWEAFSMAKDIESYKAFFSLPDTRDRIQTLYEGFLAANDTSLLAPIPRNYFALVLRLAGFRKEFEQEVRAIRGQLYPHPWLRVGISTYAQVQKL
jgi:hypothetical protein